MDSIEEGTNLVRKKIQSLSLPTILQTRESHLSTPMKNTSQLGYQYQNIPQYSNPSQFENNPNYNYQPQISNSFAQPPMNNYQPQYYQQPYQYTQP